MSTESGVACANLSDTLHGIAFSGPRARDLLARLSRDNVTDEAMKFRDIRRAFFAGVPAPLARLPSDDVDAG